MSETKEQLLKSRPRVALVSIASQYIHSSLAPWCLKAGLETYAESDLDVCIIEGTINETVAAVAKRILNKNPMILGFSCYIWNIRFVLNLLPLLKSEIPQVRIILGGPEVTSRPQEILEQEPFVDYVIAGEGEKPLACLVDAILNQEPVKGLPGVCLRHEQETLTTTPYFHEEMQPSPYCEDYFSQLNGRIAYLETSRGCPFSCAFCLSGRKEKVRFAPMERAKQELVMLAQTGSKTIKLVDRTFNANPERAKEIFRFIIDEYGKKLPESVCFHFEIAGDLLDDETLDILSKAPCGLIQMEIGVQSLNAETLTAVRRKTDIEYLFRCIQRLIRTNNIHVHIDLIAGLPLEGLSSFKQGFNHAFSLRPHALQLGFLKVIPGSAMREEAHLFPMEYSPVAPYEVISTPWLSPDELKLLHIAENALDRLYNSGRFINTLAFLVDECRCPAFDILLKIGEHISKLKEGISLDQLTDAVHEFLQMRFPGEKVRIRDLMLVDRLRTTATSFIPHSLRITDPRFAKAKEALRRQKPPLKGVMRGHGICYSTVPEQMVWVDYAEINPVTGCYPVHGMDLEGLLQSI